MCAAIRGSGATRLDSSGRLILEAKEHIKERLSFSPDLGDAAALTFAVDLSRPARVQWSEPSYGPPGGPHGWLAT